MVIEESEIIALLVEKTGRPRDEVEDQLDQLKRHIQNKAAEGLPFSIDNFGVFFKQAGQLEFEPDERLKMEINQKYAGMTPIELMEGYKETGAGIPVEEPSAKPTKSTKGKETTAEPEPSPAAESGKPQDSHKEKALESEPDDTQPPTATTNTPSFEGRKKNPAGKVVAAILVLIIILGGGWLLYSNGFFNKSQKNNTGQIVAPPDNTKPTDSTQSANEITPSLSGDSTKIDTTSGGMNDTTVDSTADLSTQTARSTPTYGLHGPVNRQVPNAFTIAIYSFRLKPTVQNIAKNLRQKGYRTVIFQNSEQNANSRWRVGLGQFQTEAEARRAVQNLPDPYNSNYTILRITHLNL